MPVPINMSEPIVNSVDFALIIFLFSIMGVGAILYSIVVLFVFLTANAPPGFCHPFTISLPSPITIRHRIVLGGHLTQTRRWILVIGSLEIGLNHYVWHWPYPRESHVWVYITRLDRQVPALVINFDRTSQQYLVDLGRSTHVVFASSVLGRVADSDWTRLWLGGNQGREAGVGGDGEDVV